MFWSPNRSTGRIQRTASIVLFPVNTLEGDNPRHCEGRRSPSHVPLAPAIWFACDLPRTRGRLDPFWTAGDPLERVSLIGDHGGGARWLVPKTPKGSEQPSVLVWAAIVLSVPKIP